MQDANPYESPKVPDRRRQTPSKRSAQRLIFAILLGLLSIPAAAIAFFFTCLATLDVSSFGPAPLVFGGVAGVTVLGGMAYLAMRIAKTPPN